MAIRHLGIVVAHLRGDRIWWLRCWGSGFYGNLGYGNRDDLGDDETPAQVGDVPVGTVPVGGNVTQIGAGEYHTCALLDTGAVRCWGESPSGELGYNNTDTVGTGMMPATAGDIPYL